MSGAVISKSPSVVVVASETATATDDIRLSWCDKLYGHMPVTALFVFEHAIQEPLETIKRGLSQALVHYYPMAGRYSTGATADEVVIKCTGEGVPFVAASASCAIKDVEALSDPSLQRELAMDYPATATATATTRGRYSELDPLVLMQVTVFSCGGFVLGVTWSHAVADGVGIGQFVQAVGELARGLPSPSIVPVRHAQNLASVSQDLSQHLGGNQPPQMAALAITVEPSLVSRIKDKYASINSGRPCTVFEAVAAVLWRCRTRAIGSSPESLAVLTFAANVRKHLGAEGYYGNCIITCVATASSGAVGNGDVMDIVKAVQRAKDGVAAAAPKQPEGQQGNHHEPLQLDLYNILSITSWRNIGLEKPDFGGGKPERVKCHMRAMFVPLCVACTPSPCKDGYSVLSISVKEDHAAAFLQEVADMHLNYI